MIKFKPASLMVFLMVSMLLSPWAEARLGGFSSHGYSHSSSWGGSYGSSGSSRLGGGGAVGMQRNDVAQRVQSGSYSAPGYVAPGSMAGAATPYRPGWGAVAGAATAGGLLGYMFGSHGGYGGGMMGGGGGMGSLLLLLLIVGGGIYFLTRRRTPTVSPRQVWAESAQQTAWASPAASSAWTEDADGIFRELQAINARKDEAALLQYCTAALARDLMPNMGGSTQVIALRSEVVDQQDGLVSVRFRGTVMEDGQHPEQVDELWHFVRNPGSGRSWLLSGIQPL